MKNNLIINDSQEKEINKILQDGIDKSLLYINSLNLTNLTNFSRSTKNLKEKTKTKIYSKTTNPSENRIFWKNSKTNFLTKKIKEFKPFTKSQLYLKSKSINNTMKLKTKKEGFIFQNKYNKKKEELEKLKNELIQERIRQNKLQKEMNSKIKKEKEFNKLEEKDNMIEKNSEDLFLKIQQSEKIREEQTKIIERLLSEYNFMINQLRRNPNIEIINKYEELKLEADNLKKEGMKVTKKKKVSKKFIKK